MKNAIYYTITPNDPAAHLFKVTVTVPSPDPAGQLFALPAWIPGSYMIREFARNIVEIRAKSGNENILLEKQDKHTWLASPCHEPLTLEYDVYAWDLSVRTGHLDQTHAFFNGTSVYLRVIGQEHLPHIVDIRPPADPACANWRVATSLPELDATRHAFGTYIAGNYDELIDHPVEMGTFALAVFEAFGVPHEIAITGRVPNLDMDRLVSDLTRICETQIRFFEPETRKPPMDRYVFLVMAIGNGYGGLEHRASTALLCSRSDLPAKPSTSDSTAPQTEGYQNFLGLC
ncbi:peptidase M61, partial [Oxalobacter sp. OttesenSCG-928-P03]|nr:peptidase M61 [Oxalobacter sp. OttesenSCG-928-P03]